MNTQLISFLQMIAAPRASTFGTGLVVSEEFLEAHATELREATERNYIRMSGFADLTGPLAAVTLLPQGRAALGLPEPRHATLWTALARLLAMTRPTFDR